MVKTILKFAAIVIFFAILPATGCSSVSSSFDNSNETTDRRVSPDYDEPKITGRIKSDDIDESSGIAASRCTDDVFWTHNDSGDKAILYAINSKGDSLGAYKIPNADNDDWEDIAAFRAETGECFLFIADIGNNELDRNKLQIYKLKEPRIDESHKKSSKKSPFITVDAEVFEFSYPKAAQNAETLMIHPVSGDVYIISKSIKGPAGVFKIAAGQMNGKGIKPEKIADLAVPAVPNGFFTGGDISPDGKRLVICDYFSAYELVLPDDAENFDDIWKVMPEVVLIGERNQGEAIAYAADGKSLYATSEKHDSPVINVKRK